MTSYTQQQKIVKQCCVLFVLDKEPLTGKRPPEDRQDKEVKNMSQCSSRANAARKYFSTLFHV
jgi:hypothetical protein